MTSAIPGGADQAALGAQQAVNDATTIRIGRVVAYDSQTISVLFSAGASYTVFDNIAYLKNYRPVLGDYVMVQKYANQWIVMGPMSYNLLQNNVVKNPSFELNSVPLGSTPPLNWTWFHDSGLSTANQVQVGTQSISSNIIDGTNAMALYVSDTGVTTSRFSSDWLYSDAFPVIVGETWTASAYMQFISDNAGTPGAANGDVSLYILFYTSPLDAVSSPVAGPNTPVGSFQYNGTVPDWVLVTALSTSTAILVPPGANYARVAIWNTMFVWPSITVFGTLLVDAVAARKLTNSDGSYAR